jgi:ABC-2 type transport system ATP-binding protein
MDLRYAIDVNGLRKTFGQVEVLRGVDLHVEKGTMRGLLGPNGAGKTTIVRILSTLLPPDGGTATVAGHDVVRQAAAVRRAIGVTGQQTAVDGLLTGHENLVLMGRLFRLGAPAARQRAGELLNRFDLAGAAGRQVKTYSGGMRRKLDLAVSLITAPPVLFLDEPTTGLDPRSRSAVWDAIRELLADGVTILLTTQYLEEADRLADQVTVIDEGRIVADGTPAALKRRVGTERLELTFTGVEALTRARAALGVDDGRRESGDLGLSVPVDGVRDVKRVLDDLDRAQISLENLRLSQPTLDDVFLALTGQPMMPAGPVGGERR